MTGPTTSIREPALFSRLRDSKHVLLAGAGGGFDIFAGLPIALALQAAGKRVSFANLSFAHLSGTSAEWLHPNLAVVTPETTGQDRYFPERVLAQWLSQQQGSPSTVFALANVLRAPRAMGESSDQRTDL